MEPQEVDSIIRYLVAIAAHQNVINDKQDLTNQRLIAAIERVDATLAAIKDLLQRGQNGR